MDLVSAGKAINRTMVELKFSSVSINGSSKAPINRTMVELKYKKKQNYENK